MTGSITCNSHDEEIHTEVSNGSLLTESRYMSSKGYEWYVHISEVYDMRT